MRETYKDDDILIDIERACEWRASVALLEIVHDPACLQRFEELELARTMLEDEVGGAGDEPRATEGRGLERLAAALAILVILLLAPGSPGGSAALLAAVSVAAVVGLVLPRLGIGLASSST